MSVTIYDLAPTIIDSPLRTLTLRPKSPIFKLRFHNSNSRLSQPSNNNGPCLSTRQLFKISTTAVSRPTVDTHICTDSRFRSPRTFGSSTTRPGAFRRQRLARTYQSVAGMSSTTVDSGSRHAGPTCLWIGGGSYYVKIQHLRDHRACLSCSDLIPRWC